MFSYIYTNAWKSIVELLKLFYVARIYISESNAVTVGFDCCSPVEKIKNKKTTRISKTLCGEENNNKKRRRKQ